jgi:hypothetical protein
MKLVDALDLGPSNFVLRVRVSIRNFIFQNYFTILIIGD